MSLFNQLGKPKGQPNMMQLFSAFQQNPLQAMRSVGLNVPDNAASNPQAILNHLLQTGQVPNRALAQITPFIQRLIKK